MTVNFEFLGCLYAVWKYPNIIRAIEKDLSFALREHSNFYRWYDIEGNAHMNCNDDDKLFLDCTRISSSTYRVVLAQAYSDAERSGRRW